VACSMFAHCSRRRVLFSRPAL
jgi:hypothetical protein